MVKPLAHIADCSAYPGQYVPMPEVEELLKRQKGCMTQPAINMDEFDNFFKIEVSLPGVRKEDIGILVQEDVLIIKVMHKDQGVSISRPKIHEFDVNYFERQILLPEKTDAEFTTADYREGILNLIIPKVSDHSTLHSCRIVVY